jgi:hypothetical protein
MKTITVNFIGHGVGANMIEVNGKQSMITSNYQLLAKVYNELGNTDLQFYDIVKKYIKSLKDEEKIIELEELINSKTTI